jgi:hypothetical protein
MYLILSNLLQATVSYPTNGLTLSEMYLIQSIVFDGNSETSSSISLSRKLHVLLSLKLLRPIYLSFCN